MDYGNWGCEFVGDLSSRTAPPVRYPLDALWLPLSVLKSAADPKYLEESKRLRGERIERLKIEIAEQGIREPGLLIIGKNQVYLKDGNHRLLGCEAMGWQTFPVTLYYSDSQIKIRTITIGDFLQRIVPLIAERKYQ